MRMLRAAAVPRPWCARPREYGPRTVAVRAIGSVARTRIYCRDGPTTPLRPVPRRAAAVLRPGGPPASSANRRPRSPHAGGTWRNPLRHARAYDRGMPARGGRTRQACPRARLHGLDRWMAGRDGGALTVSGRGEARVEARTGPRVSVVPNVVPRCIVIIVFERLKCHRSAAGDRQMCGPPRAPKAG